MFDKTRSSHVRRLGELLDRYELIAQRAASWLEEASHASRLGLPADSSVALFTEMTAKAYEQAGLCGESITLLVRDRALPLIFSKNISKAENTASEWEYILNQSDQDAEAGRTAFRQRFGKE